MNSLLPEWAACRHVILGMVHVPALPGSSKYEGDPTLIEDAVLRDAQALCDGEVDGLVLENFGDAPCAKGRVDATTVAWMTRLATAVKQRFAVPLGVNVLRNDGRGALAIAQAAAAEFIRVNILAGARVTDQGVIEGISHSLLRDRARLGCRQIKIFADVNVKHSVALVSRDLRAEVSELVERAGADALIVSGVATGQPADAAELKEVRDAIVEVPVFVGSGVNANNWDRFSLSCDGCIVGSSLKRDGRVECPVDPERVKRLVGRIRQADVS